MQTTVQEQKNMVRITNQARAGRILQRFVEKGFSTYDGFKTICIFYDGSLTQDDLNMFWRLSHKLTASLCDKVEHIIDQKLKLE